MEQSQIGPAIGPLFDRLIRALSTAGITPVRPSVAYYEALDSRTGATRCTPGSQFCHR